MSDKTANPMVLVLTIAICIITLLPTFSMAVSDSDTSSPKKDLDPSLIPKFVNQLTGPPPVLVPTKILDPISGQVSEYYSVIETEVAQQILPAYDSFGNPTGLESTKVWATGGSLGMRSLTMT